MDAFRIVLRRNRSCSLNKNITKFVNYLFYYPPPTLKKKHFNTSKIQDIVSKNHYIISNKDSINKEKTKDELLTHIYKYRDNLEIYDKDKNKENG